MAHFAEIGLNNTVTRVIVVNDNECKDQFGNESETIGAKFCHDLFGGVCLGGPGTAGVSGGNGSGGSAAGVAGTTNTGGGGGGGNFDGSIGKTGGNGGSGIVIIRYAGSQGAGGGNYSSSGGYSIHRFTGDGTFRSNTAIPAVYSLN